MKPSRWTMALVRALLLVAALAAAVLAAPHSEAVLPDDAQPHHADVAQPPRADVAPDVVPSPRADDVQLAVPTPTSADPLRSTSSPSAKAEYTDQALGGLLTVWGHDDAASGAVAIEDKALSRLDLLKAIREHTASEGCRAALGTVLEARRHLKLWALKMHSASVTLPDALLSASMYNLGDFDGCLSVPESMYCLFDAEVRPTSASSAASPEQQQHAGDERSPFDVPHGLNGTLWDLFKTSGNKRRYRRDLQQWAVCVPAACGVLDGDLGVAVAGAVAGVARDLGVALRLHVQAEDCSVNHAEPGSPEPLPFPFQQILTQPLFLAGSLLIVAFPVLAIVATVRSFTHKYFTGTADWQAEPKKRGLLSTMLDCFAAQGNWKHLKRKQKSQIHAIQGMRTLTIVLVILGHRALNLFAGPLRNPEFVEKSYTEVFKMYIVNGNIIVSTFFVISGFLEARAFMGTITKLGSRFTLVTVLHHYFHRYLRLLPTLAVMLLVEMLWVEHLGSGPVWNETAGRAARDCKNDWWSHMLFINNYINPESLCLLQTWFLAVDMQLYLATPLVMWLVYRLTRTSAWPGVSLLGALLTAACVLHYACTVAFGLYPAVQPVPQILRRQNILNDPTFNMQYLATHANIVPFLVGMTAGTLFYLADKRGWAPPRWMKTAFFVGIPVGHLLQTATFFSGVAFYLPSFEERPFLDALYGPARMLAFCVPTAWVIFTCAMGFGGVFDWMLTWTPFVALGRLTYSVFLVHITFINVTASTARGPEYIETAPVMFRVFSDVMASYMLGLILHLSVEAPLVNLQKLVIDHSVKKVEKKISRASSPENPAVPGVSLSEGAVVPADVPDVLDQRPTVFSSKL